MNLSEIKINRYAVIKEIKCRNSVIKILNDFGVVVGTSVKVIKKAPFKGALAVYSRGFTFAIRNLDAELIEVEYEL